jgi:hypothetical protein
MIVSCPQDEMRTTLTIQIVNMIEQSDLDALQSLKNTQETITISLENELTSLKARYKALDLDHQEQKSQLVNALLSKDEILKSSSLKLEATDRSKVDNDVKSNSESLQQVEEVREDLFHNSFPRADTDCILEVPAVSSPVISCSRASVLAPSLSKSPSFPSTSTTPASSNEEVELATEIAVFGVCSKATAPEDPPIPAVAIHPVALVPAPFTSPMILAQPLRAHVRTAKRRI